MIYPFLLTALAGLATLLGTIPIFVKINDKNKLISAACAFASGVMITISIIDLIPEAINYFKNSYNGFITIIITFITIVFGIVISQLLDKMIDTIGTGNNLFKVGILSMIVIILHNIPEGIVTFIISNKNITLGLSICIAIALHNIPEGISIAIPIYYSTNNRFKAILYTFISAISELLGAILTYLFVNNHINSLTLGVILSFTAGIMIQISINKLLPTSYEYNNKTTKISFIIGIIFMIISLLLNNLIS